MDKQIQGFSKKSKAEKIDWVAAQFFHDAQAAKALLATYWNTDEALQRLHDEFTENTLTNFYLPLGVAPNFLINGHNYVLPMAIEESSVVAAACKAAKFWVDRGGFRAEVIGVEKVGQVHFTFDGDPKSLVDFYNQIKSSLLAACAPFTKNMEQRGGGILNMELVDKTTDLENYYQLHLTFRTADAMGANFINSCLEQIDNSLLAEAENYAPFKTAGQTLEVVMSILSNYVPNCRVRAEVRCPKSDLGTHDGLTSEQFADKFIRAVAIAKAEPYRAVTHNKGIMNGIDAVVLATGNDFRAVEAGVHAFASRHGRYTSLSDAYYEGDDFVFSIELPLALGTVGGLTSLHPLVKWSLELLGNPNAEELMQIVAVAGLAQNFAAVHSLVSSGIQKGHMKMHLLNILNQFKASEKQKEKALTFFTHEKVSHQAVRNFLEQNTGV
ncbi:MAG: hydroxymethylglutaryl-CoA reductase, degradative [Bacteroidetes bacterium]|nr:hydroxymethylglutaryl-CoA reductase, degradative [Bacteroidota bacterium]MDA0938467.1 hydroxymethylglutaryl-CoA reductase, degradative [Bacteroidota bacterium]MDA1345185.1 hydroxymethylglutaryl-CoA reductase, degradative [Bacteroidota bacterium]